MPLIALIAHIALNALIAFTALILFLFIHISEEVLIGMFNKS